MKLTSDRAGSPSARTSWRARSRAFAVAVALLAFATSLGGCSFTNFLHHSAALVPVSLPLAQSFDDKVRDAREQAALAPTEAYWPYHVAELYVGADSLALAETALREALARDGSYAPALALLSKLEYDSGRHMEAIQMLEGVRQKTGHLPPELLAGLALHYGALERSDLAATAMAGMAHSERSEVNTALVCITLQGVTPDSATALAAELVRKNPHSAACQNNYGITRLRSGDPDGARSAFEKAIDLDPKLPGPYYNLAILEKFYVLDDDAAARWFKKYQARSSDDPDGLAKLFEPAAQPGLATQRD